MKPEVMDRLNQINREFYATFAASFAETRSEAGRELEVILPYIPDGARVLDVGCGNGRVATLLARQQRKVTYIGIDSSEALIARCKKQEASRRAQDAFLVVDITRPDWPNSLLPRGEPPDGGRWPGMKEFDRILLLAVLHHIPGREVRARIMRQVRDLLALQGRAIVSTWQFMDNERMRSKIVPWNTVGIDEGELEPGDVLLNWKRGGLGLRYCHQIGEDEVRVLAAQAGLAIGQTFRAGGREGNLSLYGVLAVEANPSQR